jgi:hypothetical protein
MWVFHLKGRPATPEQLTVDLGALRVYDDKDASFSIITVITAGKIDGIFRPLLFSSAVPGFPSFLSDGSSWVRGAARLSEEVKLAVARSTLPALPGLTSLILFTRNVVVKLPEEGLRFIQATFSMREADFRSPLVVRGGPPEIPDATFDTARGVCYMDGKPLPLHPVPIEYKECIGQLSVSSLRPPIGVLFSQVPWTLQHQLVFPALRTAKGDGIPIGPQFSIAIPAEDDCHYEALATAKLKNREGGEDHPFIYLLRQRGAPACPTEVYYDPTTKTFHLQPEGPAIPWKPLFWKVVPKSGAQFLNVTATSVVPRLPPCPVLLPPPLPDAPAPVPLPPVEEPPSASEEEEAHRCKAGLTDLLQVYDAALEDVKNAYRAAVREEEKPKVAKAGKYARLEKKKNELFREIVHAYWTRYSHLLSTVPSERKLLADLKKRASREDLSKPF